MNLYRATDHAAAVRALCKAHERVVIRPYCATRDPFRFSSHETRKLGAFRVRRPEGPWKFAPDVPVVYSARPCAFERLPPHDAQYIVECPPTEQLLHGMTLDATVAVVFEPPTWEKHEDVIRTKFPEVDLCQSLWNHLYALPRNSQFAETLGVPPCGVVAEDDLCAALNVDIRTMRAAMRRAVNFYCSHRVLMIYPRVPPEHDLALLAVYNAILQAPDWRGAKAVIGWSLHKTHGSWARMLAMLCSRGNISIPTALYTFRDNGMLPDYISIKHERLAAFENLENVKARLLDAPLLPTP